MEGVEGYKPGASGLRESVSFTLVVWKMTGTNIAVALRANTACMNLSTLYLHSPQKCRDPCEYLVGRFTDADSKRGCLISSPILFIFSPLLLNFPRLRIEYDLLSEEKEKDPTCFDLVFGA
jgi:hypothetical protein